MVNRGCKFLFCPCEKYKYNYEKTISEDGEAGRFTIFKRNLHHTLTLRTGHMITDNRCDCGHFNTDHGNCQEKLLLRL
jgi:hypothetical protein